jgi:hypothetical protein
MNHQLHIDAMEIVGQPITVSIQTQDVKIFIEQIKQETFASLLLAYIDIHRLCMYTNLDALLDDVFNGKESALFYWNQYCTHIVLIACIQSIINGTDIEIYSKGFTMKALEASSETQCYNGV